MGHVASLRPVAVLSLLGVLIAGCGVSFSSPPDGTEFFKSLTISGELTAGSPLTAAVEYEQNNPVLTEIQCEIRQDKTLVKAIGSEKAALHPLGGPTATAFPGNFSLDFSLDQPGTYKAECFTPADQDNFILKTFTIRPAAKSTPPPTGESAGGS